MNKKDTIEYIIYLIISGAVIGLLIAFSNYF